jgi:hypothetical protein
MEKGSNDAPERLTVSALNLFPFLASTPTISLTHTVVVFSHLEIAGG